MRHNPSSWARQDARPYDNVPYNHGAYDRARPYDNRPDSRRYYDERYDNSYPPEYDMPSYASNNGGPPMGQRHYRDLPPHQHRPENYPPNR